MIPLVDDVSDAVVAKDSGYLACQNNLDEDFLRLSSADGDLKLVCDVPQLHSFPALLECRAAYRLGVLRCRCKFAWEQT